MPPTLRIGQSADPDDAFMAWALQDVLEQHGVSAQIVYSDIEDLNRRALAGELDLTALSVGAYPQAQDSYRMLRCGASFGDRYGPIVVSRRGFSEDAGTWDDLRVAVPGHHTTATLLLRIYRGTQFEAVPVPFDEIMDAVADERVDAGLIIHEGQLVFERVGLRCLFEPAVAWADEEALPLPLGIVVVRRSLSESLQHLLAEAFLQSVHRAFEHPEAALDFAARHARGLDRPTLEQYVYRYVNASTLDMGSTGQRAIERLFERALAADLIEAQPRLDPL